MCCQVRHPENAKVRFFMMNGAPIEYTDKEEQSSDLESTWHL